MVAGCVARDCCGVGEEWIMVDPKHRVQTNNTIRAAAKWAKKNPTPRERRRVENMVG